MKKLIAILLTIAVFFSLAATAYAAGLDNFVKSMTYREGQFNDVAPSHWYAANVRSVYEYGIMNGVSANRFDVRGNVTIAQAITIACRIHQIYNETDDVLTGGKPWYQPYVAYAQKYDIVGDIGDAANEPIERYGFAMILSAALPDEALREINKIKEGSIPDVCLLQSYSDHVYRLYRAGILTGMDKYGTFAPYTSITRAESAAIISRIVELALRKTVKLTQRTFQPVPMNQLSNLKSIQKSATNAQLAEAYEAAREIITPIAYYDRADQLYCIASALRQIFDSGMSYSMSTDHYNDPYGFFILGSASCAGCTRATGLCLNMLGIPYEHVNENQYSHQWCRVPVNGEYWICDAFGLCCGPEPAPYQHPYL